MMGRWHRAPIGFRVLFFRAKQEGHYFWLGDITNWSNQNAV